MTQHPMADGEADEKTGGIQVIARAAGILRHLGDAPEGLSLAALAARTGLARSTVQQIVQALEAEGFVELIGPQGGFQLGPALSQLVYQRQIDIVSAVRPFLEELGDGLGETVSLCMLSGDRVAVIDRHIAEQMLRVVFPLGTIPRQACDMAPGRVLLAGQAPDRGQQILARILAGQGAAEVARQMDLLNTVRAEGRASDIDDFVPGLSGFAVPLRTRFGLYALTVVTPSARGSQDQDRFFAALGACRDRIEGKIGAD